MARCYSILTGPTKKELSQSLFNSTVRNPVLVTLSLKELTDPASSQAPTEEAVRLIILSVTRGDERDKSWDILARGIIGSLNYNGTLQIRYSTKLRTGTATLLTLR